MSPNCSGVDEPAQRVDRQLERLAPRRRGLADLPGGRVEVLLRMALATSMAVMLRAASFCGSSQARML